MLNWCYLCLLVPPFRFHHCDFATFIVLYLGTSTRLYKYVLQYTKKRFFFSLSDGFIQAKRRKKNEKVAFLFNFSINLRNTILFIRFKYLSIIILLNKFDVCQDNFVQLNITKCKLIGVQCHLSNIDIVEKKIYSSFYSDNRRRKEDVA